MSKQIVHVGPVGMGSRMKLVNNLCMAGAMEALFEGLTLGRKGSLRRSDDEGPDGGALSSPLLKMKGEAVLEQNFEPLFSVKHTAKDVHLALEEAKGGGASLPLASLLDQIFPEAGSRGLSEEDYASIVKLLD